jgi:signal transduction histidine kinase
MGNEKGKPMDTGWDSANTSLHFARGVGLAVFGLDGKLLFANRNFCDIYGFRRDELPDLESFNRHIIEKATKRTAAGNIPHPEVPDETAGPVSLTIDRHDAEPIYADIHFTLLYDKSGKLVGTGVVAIDVTSCETLKKAHEDMELEYLNAGRMAILGELAGGIAHNINNPLAGLMGYLDLLAEDYPSDERLGKCIVQCRRIADLTQNLAYHGRNALMTGSVKTDVNELIKETLLLMSSSKLYNDLRIEVDLSSAPVYVVGNPGDLTQVLLNLLHNARDAVWGKADRWVTIKTSTKENNVLISVADNGTGIPGEILGRIFEPFFTTKPLTPAVDQSPAGNGLGLSTVRRLIARHGGRIEVASEVGKGSTFRIILPNAEYKF